MAFFRLINVDLELDFLLYDVEGRQYRFSTVLLEVLSVSNHDADATPTTVRTMEDDLST